MMVPSRARMIVGLRSVTSPSLAESWHAVSHELQKFRFFSRLGPIRHDHDYAIHTIDIIVVIVC